MSQISKLVEQIKYVDHVEDLQDKSKISVTVRIEPQHIFKIDHLAKKCGSSRAGMAAELLISAAMDAMSELGYDDQEQFDMWSKSLKLNEEAE